MFGMTPGGCNPQPAALRHLTLDNADGDNRLISFRSRTLVVGSGRPYPRKVGLRTDKAPCVPRVARDN